MVTRLTAHPGGRHPRDVDGVGPAAGGEGLRMPPRRLPLLLGVLTALAAAVGPGCGEEERREPGEPRTEAQTLTAGGLRYRTIIFRQLNPLDETDARLVDLSPAGEGRLWFGAFITVCNVGDEARRAPEGFAVVDAFGQAYPAVDVRQPSAFLYEPAVLDPDECLPLPDTSADRAGEGALLVFRLPVAALSDRPLFLRLPPEAGGAGPPLRIQLDV